MEFLSTHIYEVISAVVAILSAVIAVCVLIPGDEPEKTLQKIVDFLKSISVKKQ